MSDADRAGSPIAPLRPEGEQLVPRAVGLGNGRPEPRPYRWRGNEAARLAADRAWQADERRAGRVREMDSRFRR